MVPFAVCKQDNVFAPLLLTLNTGRSLLNGFQISKPLGARWSSDASTYLITTVLEVVECPERKQMYEGKGDNNNDDDGDDGDDDNDESFSKTLYQKVHLPIFGI